MKRMRQIVPLVAALLTIVVFVETTDLILCPDDLIEVRQIDASSTVVSEPGSVLLKYSPHDRDARSQENCALARCLCNVTFISMAVSPVLQKPTVTVIRYTSSDMSAKEGELHVPGPVPLTLG